MKRNLTVVIVFLLVSSLHQGGCAEIKSTYRINDAGLPAERNRDLVWLDNHRLRFYSHRKVEVKTGGFRNLPTFTDPGHYIWDLDSNRIEPDSMFKDAMRLCVHGDYVTFLRKSPNDDKRPLLVTRDKGQETVTRLVNIEWFNRFNCHYYDEKPDWIIQNHETLPLLDGHGFLDWIPTEGPGSDRNKPIRFHRTNASEWLSLPIGKRQVWRIDVTYASFKDAYFLYPITYIDTNTGKEEPIGPWPKGKSVSVWWLASDGTVTSETIPYMEFMRGGSRGFFPTRKGIFIYSHKADGAGKPGDAGGYLAQDNRVTKLITGLLEGVSISPDGCRVAFVHDPYDSTYGKDRLDRVTVKGINLCEEDGHGR